MSKTAVILFNLGGPDRPKAVRPFLFNLFNDPAIITMPQPFRWLLATLISCLRRKKAQSIYQHMGGKSPILEQTQAQGEALEQRLNRRGPDEYRVFVCMRHWHPMSSVVAKKVKAYAPDRIVLLPLYPQFSTTTTGSAFNDWYKTSAKLGIGAPTSGICCYPTDLGFIAAQIKLIKDMYWKAAELGKPRLLFSAHGLPEKMVAGGDPYQWQVEATVATIVQIFAVDDLDYVICYQSRVGRLEWIKPSTEEEIHRAGRDQVPVLIVPIAFVSEHSETLVELDIDYANLAKARGVPSYWRVPTLGTEPFFIDMLSDLCREPTADGEIRSGKQGRICPKAFGQCLCTQTQEAA